MTDPSQPRPRGRHSQPDAALDAGRPASELLASWAGADPQQLDESDALRPRRRRRHAPDTDAAGVRLLPARGAVDVADVEITGLAAGGIADAGLAAAGLDLSVFGIDRPGTSGRAPRSRSLPRARAEATPQTSEMPAVPLAVPHLGTHAPSGRSAGAERRSVPSPRAADGPTTADRVAADRFADADTDPGWLSTTGRPAPRAAARVSRPAQEPADGPSAAGGSSLTSLFAGAPVTDLPAGHPSVPLHDLVTEVHAAVGEHGARDEDGGSDDWSAASARHHTDEPEDDGVRHPHEHPDEHHDDRAGGPRVFDQTGGLELVVTDDPGDDFHDDDLHDADFPDDGGGGRGRRGGGGRGGGPGRRRGPITTVLSLVVLAALVVGIVVGGRVLWNTINPVAEDYSGSGTGSVDVRVEEGDSLRAIAGTLVDADVIASGEPFEDAAEANPAATGIQPGVYSMRLQMSGQAALDLLLDPASRQLSKVTVPEGLTSAQVLQRLADQTGLPLADLQAAAADPAALGLPAYANGMLEGFLFPATYDIEPDDTATTVLSEMVAEAVQALDELQVPEDQRLTVVTKASIVQAEAGSVEDMGKVARVLENRLSDGMPLQLDTTVNYANGKAGITTTNEDRQNSSPYNTYLHPGLPPGAISNPGEEALRAVLAPTPGEWRFFVVVDPDTGDTRFAVTAAEHQQNVLLFQQWLRDHPGN